MRVDGPVGKDARHGDAERERRLDAVVTRDIDGLLVFSYGRCLADSEDDILLSQRLYLAVVHIGAQPGGQGAHGPRLSRAAPVHEGGGHSGAGCHLGGDGKRVLLPHQRILVDISAPGDRLGKVAVLIVDVAHGEVQRAAFHTGGILVKRNHDLVVRGDEGKVDVLLFGLYTECGCRVGEGAYDGG